MTRNSFQARDPQLRMLCGDERDWKLISTGDPPSRVLSKMARPAVEIRLSKVPRRWIPTSLLTFLAALRLDQFSTE